MAPARPFYKSLYFFVLVAIASGVVLGLVDARAGEAMKPLGDAFIKLVKMMIAPIIFFTVVSGIAGMGDMKKVGRVGVKALVYFEVVSTVALGIGLVVGNVARPGDGFHVDPSTLTTESVAGYAAKAQEQSTVDFLLRIIPETLVGAFAKGDILQVLLFSILFGFALAKLGERAKAVTDFFDAASDAIFGVIHILMKLAPIGAFGAMAFTIGKYGVGSLEQLALLVGAFYVTAVAFVVVVLGSIAAYAGFNIFRFIAYIKEELLVVLGTSSSESALPSLMEKLEKLGCSKSVVGLVVPTGYSFNLDGTNIYMTLATLFIAQATGIELTLDDQLKILVVAMLTSKGASGVTGAGFTTLAATLAVVPSVPIGGMSLILGVDRFMSECRALTNMIGNGVAAIVVARWEGELDRTRLTRELTTKEKLVPAES
jgi:aerobic C4-dicarboxylate transport protein